MFVVKRNGEKEPVAYDKITQRIRNLCDGLSDSIDPAEVAQKVCSGVYKGVTTTELDELAAETAAHLSTRHPDFSRLAARIAISNLQKNTNPSFVETCTQLYKYVEPKTGQPAPMLSDKIYGFIQKHAKELEAAIVHQRDLDNYDYFGFKTMEKSYLYKINGKVVERPQYLFMRVSCGIHGDDDDLKSALETYDLMSQNFFTHASPTLFNAGSPHPQMSSCFLLTMKDDSIDGIYDTLKRTAQISKYAGGIGLAVHNIRAQGSYIKGTNGTSNGLIPMLRVFNNTARYVDQGGGKRKGAFAIYLEPWHADIFAFLDLKKNHGVEEERARDLFYGLWIPDLFMQRVAEDADWSLMCPHECPGLADCFGDVFETLYRQYETAGKARKVVKARQLWQAILESQIETGTPYILYKDACNKKSNQQNLGTIKCSNLCTEVVQYTSADEIAVCNLASIALPKFVRADKTFDYQRLFDVTKVITRNLNKVIDINHYPVPEARNSNLRHRPIGIGVQGLADVFSLMRCGFESKEAIQVNRDIFETIYFAALTASMELSKVHGPYKTYQGSPISKGIFQWHMWNVKQEDLSGRWNWDALQQEILQHGVRNSLLVAPMPTATTSQILGNNECMEPYTSNLYVRRTLAGEFVCINRHLVHDLIELGLWDEHLKNKIVAHNGSVQNIDEIPASLKQLYKTVWEIPQRVLIDMAADRGAFVDQSQSFNVFMPQVNFGKLTSMHFYAWKKGLKTGMYYLRTKPAADAIKFTVDPNAVKEASISCSLKNKDECTMCSS